MEKRHSWKSSEFDQSASEKTSIFSAPSFRFWIWCKRGNSELKTSEKDSPRFLSFPRTLSFRPRLAKTLIAPVFWGLFAANFESYQMKCPARAWPVWFMHRTVCVLVVQPCKEVRHPIHRTQDVPISINKTVRLIL